MTWQRARSDEQKNDRINEILIATTQLLEQYGYDAVTMQMIATKAKFTRSNLYRYFQTKEEIFITLISADYTSYFNAIKEAIKDQTSMTIEAFSELLYHVSMGHERLLHLQPMLSISLERNSSEEILTQFKTQINLGILSLCEPIKTVFPFLHDEDCFEITFFQGTLISGLYPMTLVNDTLQKVLANPELAHLKMDFRKYFIQSTIRYLYGLKHERTHSI